MFGQVPNNRQGEQGDCSWTNQGPYCEFLVVNTGGKLTIQSGPTNHAFILRRYDTDAISLTTMYKVAFPGATDEDEKREMDWVSLLHIVIEISC